jgi:hypothetical protein
VGFNMSWIFVDGINEDALYEALDLVATDETPDPHDLGTSHVPLAGTALKSGGCAVFARYALVMDATVGTNPARLTRLPASCRCIMCVVLEHAMVSYASLWQDGRYAWQIRHDSSHGAGHLEVRFIEQFNLLKQASCKGPNGCAHATMVPQHGHMSEVYAINAVGTPLGDEILDFVKTGK